MTFSTAPDILVPPFDSPQRKSPLVVATFNLSATIIGGGVLSLPYAFSKTGLWLGTLLMVIAAVMTERSLFLLCLCSRLTGATTYGEVGEAAFGPWMEYFVSGLLGIFLLFVIIAYMVLAGDIWSSLVQIAVGLDNPPPNKDLVLVAILILIAPCLVQGSLHALRFNCYIGFASVSILCIALVHHAWTTSTDYVLWWSNELKDILIAFPIITLSFLSIFNVLPIQNALLRPTRSRILLSIDGAMISCFVLTSVFGVAGFLYAGKNTDGNILNNCDASGNDRFLLLGKVGCGITVVLAMPMMLLPCRASLLEVLDVLVHGPHKTPVEKEEENQTLIAAHDDSNPGYGSIPPEQQPTTKDAKQQRTMIVITDNTLVHYVSTLLIVLTCYVVAINVPGVAIVWSIIDCFMGYLLSFMLPCACYLRIQTRYPGHSLASQSWVWFSWVLLIASTVASLACTIETVTRLV
jgi:amino acid permease